MERNFDILITKNEKPLYYLKWIRNFGFIKRSLVNQGEFNRHESK